MDGRTERTQIPINELDAVLGAHLFQGQSFILSMSGLPGVTDVDKKITFNLTILICLTHATTYGLNLILYGF